MRIPRRYWRNLDWPLIAAVLALIMIGMVVIYSASHSQLEASGLNPYHYVYRQLLALGMGVAVAILIISIDYRAWIRWTRIIYLGNILLLAGVLLMGKTAFGSQRWVKLGPLNIQPSELAKIGLILVLAKIFSEKEQAGDPRAVGRAFLLTLIPTGLILLQPDMGTGAIFICLLFTLWFIGGAKPKHILIAGGSMLTAAAAGIIVSSRGWLKIIKPYQLKRLLVFLDPYSDPTGSGWNIIQSMIAIGSGGFLGKGLLNGTQSSLRFLPANHTDFVFSVIAEELGFLGSVAVLALYVFLIWRGLRVAAIAKDTYGALLATGATSIFFFHLLINVGMTLGIMPVTGLPLPFITAGGSTMLTSLLAIGIILNVGLRRIKIMF